MRCSGTSCGKEGDGKFCEECGAKMVEEKMDTVVICSGKLEDSSSCGSELVPGQKFCKSCGTKVDQLLFTSLQDTCPECGKVFDRDAKFCMECGYKLKKPTTEGPLTSIVKKLESSVVIDKSDCTSGMEALADSKQNDSAVTNDTTHFAGSKDGDRGSNIQSQKGMNSEMEADISLTDHDGEKRDEKEENKTRSDSTGSVNTDKAHSEVSANYSGSPLNIEAGQATENKLHMKPEDDSEMDARKTKSEICNETEQTDIAKDQTENIDIVHESSHADLSEQLKEVHIEKGKPGNLNIVDSTQSATNDDNRKGDTETTDEDQKVGEEEDDTMEVQSNESGQVKRSKSQKENEKKRKQETAETRSDQENEENAKGTSKGSDFKQFPNNSDKLGHGRMPEERNTRLSLESPEQTADNTPITKEDLDDMPKETGKTENSKDISEVSNTREKMEDKNNKGNETNIAKTPGMIFGTGRSFGMNETGGNYEVKTPFGKNLFTVSNKPNTGEGSVDEQRRGDDNVNNNETSEDTVMYSNDFTEDNGQTPEEGTDVDKPAGVETRSKAKAKVAEQNKNKQKSKKPSKTEEKQLKAAERKFNEKCIKVQFHVLTSEEFRFEPSKDKCILVIGKEEMGGWNKRDRFMKEKRKIEGFIYEMVYEELIPTRLVAGGSSIPYKYLIIKQDKPEKEYWEHYLKNYKAGEGYDRDLTVSLKLKSIDIWHQFDCFMEQEPRSLKDKLFDYIYWKKDLIKHAEKAAHVFCPDLMENEKSHISVDEIVLQLKMLSESMKKIYMIDGKCWYDFKEFTKIMGSYITAAFMKQCNLEQLQTSETREKRERATVTALYFLYVMKTLDLGMPDKKSLRTLSKALLVSVDTEKKECPDLWLIDRHFTGKREALLEAMTSFVKKIAGASKDPCWLPVMPWVHFLSGKCAPFEIPPVDVKHDEYKPVWWGVVEIEKELDYFKGKSEKWSITVENILKHLQPLFEVDYFLPRSFIAAVDLGDLQKVIETRTIPVEACLAHLTYRLKTIKPHSYYDYGDNCNKLHSMTNDEKTVQQCVNSLLKQLQETFYSEELVESQWTMSYIIASHMLRKSIQNKRIETVYLCAQVLIHCIAMYDRMISEQKTPQEVKATKHQEVLQDSARETVRWVETYGRWDVQMKGILEVWNNIFAPVELQSEEVRNTWNKIISEGLVYNLEQKVCREAFQMQKFVELYCQKLDEYNPSMQECLSKVAFVAIAKGYTVDYVQFLPYQNKRFGSLLSELFISEWNKNVKTGKDEDITMLRHILRWPPFSQYLKIYYKDQKKMEMLTEKCLQHLIQAVSVIDSRVTALLTGSMTIGDFNQITEKDGKFSELAELIQIKKEHTAAFITKAIEIRQKELGAFQVQAKEMATLASVCTQLANVDRKCIDDTLKKQEHIERHQIKEFCEPAVVTKVDIVETYQPRLCAFRVSPTVMSVVPQLHACCESSTFMMFWNAQCQEVYNQCATLDDVVQKVWSVVKNRWDTVTNRIKSGDIKFKDFEKVVGQRYRDSYDPMRLELKVMNIPEKCIKERLDQLMKYRQLETCVKGAKTILRFAQEFKLKGDFTQIRVIATHGENDQDMKAFDNSVMKACEFLKDLTPDKEKCLKMFVTCEPLVNWLKESMKKSGLKELKVFVDLAFMSAGDEPINIARVQCLHSAVTGYAPLIFDLDERCGYKQLLNLCAVVWKELEANPKLPEKLRDTNRQLQWLKEIKKAHGSVEVTSLMQAEAINANGIFTVGRNAWKKDAQTQNIDGTLMELADTLKLTVPEQEGKRELRNYTFSQLQDLQSRLMLVAGKAEKGTDSVDRFTMIFDSITRLSSVYMKLCSSGCVLFKDWTARFLCDPKPNRPVCAVLEFGQGDGAPQLKGRRSETEDLQDMIPELANFMETCLEEWLKYIKEKRKSYLHLNYFTVDQLVILQRELVKMGPDSEPSHLVYPLLSAVKDNCTPDDLLEAMTAAKEEIEGDAEMEAEGDDDDIYNEGAETVEDSTEDEKKQNFVQELVQAGYEEGLAIRALEFVDPEDVTAGIVWCMDHEDTAMSDDNDQQGPGTFEPMREQLTQRPTFSGWSQSQTDIQTMITANITGLGKQNTVGSDPLINDLKALWNKFLESISSNIRDYLSLEHLGLILRYLSGKDTSEVSRSLPPGFKEGQPNLIICPSGDVLMTTLSVYMMDKDQPLPQSDEILMCTSKTTKDEVDIFWRRAIFDGARKIHCLMNADLLDYDVSEAAERCLEEYLLEVYHNKDLKYRLLVICGSDNEYKSTIVSSLDKYKRQPLPTNPSHLREYLSTKLIIQQQPVTGVRPAAYVDQQRSSVRVVKSWRAGVGKTLYKQRRVDEVSGLNRGNVRSETVSIPLQEKTIDLHYVIKRLLEHTTQPGELAARLFHIDVSHEVENGVDYLLFNLLTLGCLMDKTGFVWRKSPTDIYLIETMPLMMQTTNRRGGDLQYVHPMLNILPDLTCRSPQESLQIYMGIQFHDYKDSDQLFDEKQFSSPVFQRTFQYLLRLDQGRQLDDVFPHNTEGNPQTCLQTLLRHCGLEDPSWSELHHFVWFLNTQLVDFENNMFVSAAAAEDLPGFSKFVLRFLIQMSRDFSTRSLDMKEESPGLRPEGKERVAQMEVDDDDDDDDDDDEDELQPYQMRRTWESSPHPYLFFNSDRFSFTFLGFFIDRASGNLIDQQTSTVLERGIMAQNLYDSLVRNHAPIQENFDALPRHEKILKLCKCMGLDMPHDPDDTYELTTDNVKKIMAIYMRFRCDIPVIIMGETGCGKTRLVKFMCALQQPPGVEMTNMILMKVHGGTTNKDIIRKVREAEKVAQKNREEYGDHMYTVLFFDEANTTEAIGLIKEIMCDKSMEGKKLKLCENLKMVAACNPYRKHTDELIKKLEQAGLGYHVDADETTDRLGRVPMRRLVYRVQPLPQSLLPLVWDFGQLNTQVEDLYIRQMVRRYIREDKLPDIPGLIEVVSAVLTASQEYMRIQRDECSFVSLRDVDRVLTVMSWFYQQSQGGNDTLFRLMNNKLHGRIEYSSSEEEEEEEDEIYVRQTDGIDDVTRSLVLAVGVCYHACLKTRPEYRAHVAQYFRAPCELPGGEEQIQDEIESCQEAFLDQVELGKNIARNMALKENVFMMVVCIELRIPLFLVGKPGSSKSLAKTIVSDAMQGNAAREELFRELKQAQMVSFQCSPLSTPDGIVGTFRQCAQFQKDKDLDTFVSIVVLDEVGLAEDSPRMPLKTLHPLLEDGCQGDEKPEKYKKVAFIGISNWALDPAKMNRGILVQREVPDLEELKNSANGICQTEDVLGNWIEPLIEPMAASYLEIFEKASQNMREFYGLRDFYSLVKMVYSFVEKSKQKPTWHEMLHAIKRNFGGLDKVDPVESFRRHLAKIIHFEPRPKETDPDCSPAGLVQACLFDTNQTQSESRYLLLLTENYGALTIIQQQILSRSSDIRPITIFGSSFRSDQEYTQVCRNINKIKVCMETGNTVVLLNLENLYESLYDALNQYYVYFGGERYVDLGLGTHRVKCPVHKNFRLIVVAEKQTVYKKFPIPLINRLEKHFLTINTMLSPEQQNVVRTLEEWANRFVSQKNAAAFMQRKEKSVAEVGDVFIGHHDDTYSAIVLDVWEKHRHIDNERDRDTQVLQDAKSVLLWCATPESLVRLENSSLSNEEKKLLKHWYFDRQAHDSFIQYVNVKIVQEQCKQLFAQITTHSKLMAGVHKGEISKATGIRVEKILLLETLSSFDTEQQFSNRIQQHIQNTGKDPSLMVIQCDSGDVNANLVACARYCVMDEFEKMRDELRAPVHVVFIVQLPRGATFTGFQCGVWHSAHIDDLYTADMTMPSLQDMQDKSVAKIFTDAVTEPVAMETEDSIVRENIHGAEDMEWSGDGHGDFSPRPGTSMDDDGTRMETPESRTELGQGGEPLQLNDVLLDLQSVGTQHDHGISQRRYGQHRLNVKGLILACVQAALSMVKDKEENTSKETDRVALVLKLLHQEQVEGQTSFLHGVCFLIAKLLKEKESKTYVAHMAHHWLINEAASKENINKAGTFRRSCIQTLETKVAPILAGIIAYLDTNDNIKILQEHYQWKQELWLTILNTVDAISLQFTDLQSPTRQSDLQEVVVMTTGCEGHMFSARMPFSWLLINQITDILKLHHPAAESHDHEEGDEVTPKAESSVKVLSEHAIGKVLSCVTQEQAVTEAVREYIHDFVHTMYHAASQQEHQLVCESVFFVTNQMSNDTTESTLLHSLVNVHMAYQKLAPRLTYFRAMNSVWPECSAAIIDLKVKNPDHFMFKEQEFTFSALCLLLENLSPKGTDLNNLRGRSHWLNKVHRYRPVIEKVISLHGEDHTLYGAHSVQSVRRPKGLWSRVMVVKLFLEHVCATEREDKITIKHCMPLWMLLGEETDLKEMKSLAGVEKFLKSCNKQAMKEYMGEEVKCCLCESILEGPPFVLPCKDILCEQCYDGMKALEENKCAKCKKEFAGNWQPQRQIAKKNAIDKLKDYQKRCNTFFMDVVSQLCFANNTAPSHEVVEKLLSYIFFVTRGKHQRTRNLSIFDTGIDPNPVFRSFLLQLLMRISEENVMENLKHYLTEAEGFIRQDMPDQEQHYVELCLLVIQCLEDMFTQEANRVDVDETQYASEALRRATQTVGIEKLKVEKLYGLASARMGLAVAAKFIAHIVMNDVETRDVTRRVRKLIEEAQKLCEDTNVRWTRIYLVKHLCRCYGVDVYQTLCRNPAPFLRWINMRETNRDQVVEVSDRYIVCGESYKNVREAVTKVALGENVEHLEAIVQELHTAGGRIEPILQLAIHREISSSYLYPQEQRKLTQQVMQTLTQFIESCDAAKNKPFMQALVMNQLIPRHLAIIEGSNLRLQGIQCLIVHFLTVMYHFNGTTTLLQPLITLMKNPQAYLNSFLPTMPQDDLEDVKEALLAARNQVRGADHNPVFYRCPNGHPYVIGDCGRPATVGNCRDCGATIGGEGYRLRPGNIQDQGAYVVARCQCGEQIGGQGHNLLPTNRQDTGNDNTMTGHILGRAEARGPGPKPERTLTPAYCAAIRLLLHMAMYIGSGTNQQGVQRLIRPDIEINDVVNFLWSHINLDIDDLHRTLGRSIDDVLLLMHTIVDHVLRIHNDGDHVAAEVNQLSTKAGRRQWEIDFSAKFLQATLQNLDHTLKTTNQELAQDQRLGADPLLCLLYETDTYVERENPAALEEIPRVWRYRTPISLQHLRQEAEAKISQKQHKVLQLFLKEDHHLRALRYIPSILRLHRALFQKYQRKLDKAEASQITVGHLKREEIAGGETIQLIQDFADAWELVRESLTLYLCPTELGGMIVSKEYCNRSITDKTPVSMLLPTTKEAGLCSYVLLDFLMRKQNDFLDKYLKEANRKSGNISSVSPREVTSAHLISYDPQHDILPLVLANCQYSFEMGKGTKIEYDFAGLERQLMDRFLFSKSRIDVGRVLMIDQMVYRTEFTSAEVFRKLADKIPQETLSAAVKTQICGEIRSLPDLCTSLDNLDITISFLKSTGGQPDKTLHEFMVNTLQMETSIQSQKAQQACEFQHAQSLWLLLSVQKSKKMTENNQHTESTFESVLQEFHEELPDELLTAYRTYMKKLSIDKLSHLLEILHEYILLVVAVRQNPEDEDFIDTSNNKLGVWLYGYVEGMDNPPLDMAVLTDFPKDILYRHSVHTWVCTYGMLREKQTGNYRRY